MTHRRLGGDRGSQPQMPSQVSWTTSWFDRFAERTSKVTSRAAFFVFAVALVLVWAPSYFLFRSVDTWQLVINTATTIGTWLLVSLLQNSQRRSDQATQHKLNAVADGLAALMTAAGQHRQLTGGEQTTLAAARDELCAAVGLEERESA